MPKKSVVAKKEVKTSFLHFLDVYYSCVSYVIACPLAAARDFIKKMDLLEADGHLTLFCGIPLLLDISMSKSSMFITIKSWSARALMSEKRKHESRHFNSFVFIKGEKKQLPNRCRLQMLFYYSNQDFICLSLFNKSSLACFEEHDWQFKLEKNDFFR